MASAGDDGLFVKIGGLSIWESQFGCQEEGPGLLNVCARLKDNKEEGEEEGRGSGRLYAEEIRTTVEISGDLHCDLNSKICGSALFLSENEEERNRNLHKLYSRET